MTRNVSEAAFASLLKRWRAVRKLSQLDLSLTAGLSQRHLSFLETGRATPSRAMALQLAEALDIPLRERNQLLTAAGFAPAFKSRSLDDPDMAPIMAALEQVMTHHEPNPAIVLDRNWNVLMHNEALRRTLSVLVGDLNAIWTRICPDTEPNLLKLIFHPEGVRDHIANWHDIGPLLLGRSRREAEMDGNDTLTALLDDILNYPGVPKSWHVPSWQTPPPPVLPLEYQIGDKRLDLFSMLSTFGTAQDITADELRIETFFPADADSAALLRALADQ